MAEIEIERRPRRRGWTWLALIILIAAVALGAWLLTRGTESPIATPPATQTAPDPVVEPVTPPEQDLAPTVPRTEDAESAPERAPGEPDQQSRHQAGEQPAPRWGERAAEPFVALGGAVGASALSNAAA